MSPTRSPRPEPDRPEHAGGHRARSQPGGESPGSAVDPAPAIAYTASNGDHSTTTLTIRAPGKKPVVADLSGFEKTRNPDGAVAYGVRHPSQCVNGRAHGARHSGQLRRDGRLASVRGDRHRHGSWAVADAGGNDIVKVDRRGTSR